MIGELYGTTELYDTVELTSTVIYTVINPKNLIRINRHSNVIRVR